jgi:hypothetical protein
MLLPLNFQFHFWREFSRNFVQVFDCQLTPRGLWQVSGINQLTLEDRVKVEARYPRNWSIWLDCIILPKTFKTVLPPRNWEGVAHITEVDAVAYDSLLHAPQPSIGTNATNSSLAAAKVDEQ